MEDMGKEKMSILLCITKKKNLYNEKKRIHHVNVKKKTQNTKTKGRRRRRSLIDMEI